jgi:BirA family transcriptional regulator, biotin operon repressor / biotin---[acetyl-CoA-carboxylase] ligase
MSGGLVEEAVAQRLRGRFGKPYRYVAECASTQRLIAPDDPEGALAVSDHQTEGRGRLGRIWLDEPGAALLFSLCLRPSLPTSRWPELTPLVGRAAAEAVAALTGIEPDVKPPNDLLIGGRKVAGVLAEAAEGRIVLGIGVNVSGAPDSEPATSLEAEAGRELDRGELLVELLDRIERAYDAWIRASEPTG